LHPDLNIDPKTCPEPAFGGSFWAKNRVSCLIVALALLLMGGCQAEFNVPVLSAKKKPGEANQPQMKFSKMLDGKSDSSPGSPPGGDKALGGAAQKGGEAASGVAAGDGRSSVFGGKSTKNRGGGLVSGEKNPAGNQGSGDGQGQANSPSSSGIDGAAGNGKQIGDLFDRVPTVSVFLNSDPDHQADASSRSDDTVSGNSSRDAKQRYEEAGPKLPLEPTEAEAVWILAEQPESIVWTHPLTYGAMAFRLEDSAGLPWPSHTEKRVLEDKTRIEIHPTLPLQPESLQTYRIVFTWRPAQSSQESKKWSYLLVVDNPDLPTAQVPWKKAKKEKRKKRNRRRR
jgi:hypothetical protein